MPFRRLDRHEIPRSRCSLGTSIPGRMLGFLILATAPDFHAVRGDRRGNRAARLRNDTFSKGLLHREEPLHPLTVLNLAGVDIAFRIDSNHVQPEKLASVLARADHLADHPAVLAVDE